MYFCVGMGYALWGVWHVHLGGTLCVVPLQECVSGASVSQGIAVCPLRVSGRLCDICYGYLHTHTASRPT